MPRHIPSDLMTTTIFNALVDENSPLVLVLVIIITAQSCTQAGGTHDWHSSTGYQRNIGQR